MTTHKVQFDPNAYSITVRRAMVDDELLFVATVVEFPSVSAIAETYADAYEFVVDAIATLHKSANEMGHRFPEPTTISSAEHSGRITLRMPPWLHAQLELESQRDGMSLNQTVIALLASRVTAQSIVRDATATIAAVAKTAINTAVLMPGENAFLDSMNPSASYRATDMKYFPDTENDKWTQ